MLTSSDSPPWLCEFDAMSVTVGETERVQLSLQVTIRAPAAGPSGRNGYLLSAAYRDVATTTVTRGPEIELSTLTGIYRSRAEYVAMVTAPLTAGAYDVGLCFGDRETDVDYTVSADGTVTVLAAGIAE